MEKRLKIRHKAEAKFSIKGYQNASKIVRKCSSRRDLPFYVCSRTGNRKKVSGPIPGLNGPRPLRIGIEKDKIQLYKTSQCTMK